ncbi:MAG: hypothetical protein SPK05_04875 [Eubacteriales bacterium]|nr:hypothetical protein [Eubacteriales bacterium]
MKKNKAQGYLILAIAFVLVSVVAFVLPTQKTSVFWIAYAFTVIAFVAQLLIWKVAWSNAETLKSKFLGFPIIRVAYIYLIIQIIVFAILVGTAAIVPNWVAVIVCCLILGASSVCLIAIDVGRDEIERVEQKVQRKVSALKMLQADVEMLAKTEVDLEVKNKLTKLAEIIRYSDPMSSDALADLEGTIASKVDELKTSSDKRPLIEEIDTLLSERNAKCKALKQ